MSLHVVILAGGRGERFWPLSRTRRPKQFLPLYGERSLLQETVARVKGWVPRERIWAVVHQSFVEQTRDQLDGFLAPDRCIEEPVARNTAPAIGAAAAAIEAIDPGATMLVLPSDHWIPDKDPFHRDVERAARAEADLGGLHLFGITIGRPETGYGHVEQGEEVASHAGVTPVARFHEKPDPQTAVAYAKRPEMLWNSGVFLWKSSTILEALEEHIPASRVVLRLLRESLVREHGRFGPASAEALRAYLEGSANESIDVAVLEKHRETFVTRATFRWSDLGNWFSWGQQIAPDHEGNRGRGRFLLRDTHDCILYSEDGSIALLGVKDLIVVRLPDVTLVCSRDRAQEIRQLVGDARKREDLEDLV